ncbi:hypothetical protein [Candidatus Nitrospira neomarina]|uniref:Uncharacterized protein n=1 Tax=Candidatus Nitrospira neomarina TaxID=3020899 RepID=A0AA96K1S1_9BACT|nr:hypothetical protein [Candidatus Nitrospira neomarina]WNM63376.1 hypothetical protein PQG83_06375 [Candidatus Nitrospira neomarina]
MRVREQGGVEEDRALVPFRRTFLPQSSVQILDWGVERPAIAMPDDSH